MLIQSGPDIGALEFDFHPTVLTAYIVTDVSSGPAALTVNFDGTLSTGPTGQITQYNWNFGDGHTGAGATINHVFAQPGTYHVTLAVVNNLQAQASEEKTIIVTQFASPDFVYFLNFNENYLDNSGFAHLVNCVGVCPPFVAGHAQQGIAFDGTSTGSYLTSPYHYQYDGMPNLTASFWARSNIASGGGTVLHKHIGYVFNLSGGVLSGYLFNQAGARFDFSTPISADTNWHHYALTLESNLKLYIDGNLVRTMAFSGGISTHADRELVVGKDPWGNAFNGSLDEVRIYTRALNSAEIVTLSH